MANGENATEYFCNAAIITNYLVAAAATCFVARDKKKGALYVQYGQINGRFRNQKKVVEAYEENESILSNSIHLVLLVVSIILQKLYIFEFGFGESYSISGSVSTSKYFTLKPNFSVPDGRKIRIRQGALYSNVVEK